MAGEGGPLPCQDKTFRTRYVLGTFARSKHHQNCGRAQLQLSKARVSHAGIETQILINCCTAGIANEKVLFQYLFFGIGQPPERIGFEL